MTYINQNLLGEIQVNLVQINDRDIQNLILQDKRGNKLQILNVYNERDEEGQYTVERTLLQQQIQQHSIALGDFNIRHPRWDIYSKDTGSRATTFLNWIEENDYSIQNKLREGTFYRPNMEVPSILDLFLMKGSPTISDVN